MRPWKASAPYPGGDSLSPSRGTGAFPIGAEGATLGLPSPGSGAGAVGASANGIPEVDPEDIDILIARLERISMQMFKKLPKQLADESPADTISAEAATEN